MNILEVAKTCLRQMKRMYIRSSSEQYVRYLRKKGVEIGNNVTFHDPVDVTVDITQPTLIKIGNNVEITKGVVILSHDMAWSVKKKLNGNVLGSNGMVCIGDNVFIGINTIILKGVSIGNNVIIGCGSVITKDVEENSVYAGNPAKKIATIDDYFSRRKEAQLNEAKELLRSYQKHYGKIPPKEIFRDFFFLFETRDSDIEKVKSYKKVLDVGGNKELSLKQFYSTKPIFNGYDDFVNFCIR